MQSVDFDEVMEKQFQAIFGEQVIEEDVHINITKCVAYQTAGSMGNGHGENCNPSNTGKGER